MKYRIRVLYLTFLGSLFAIIIRLGYWQIIKANDLKAEARDQRTAQIIETPPRGNILSSDGNPLVINEPVYNLTAYIPHLDKSPQDLVNAILPHLEFQINDPVIATDPAKASEYLVQMARKQESLMLQRLNTRNYAVLAAGLSLTQKNQLESLQLAGIDFEESFTRGYPEGSSSAMITGFVGRDDLGFPQGYFGLEGYYNRELAGRSGLIQQEKDAAGNPITLGEYNAVETREGRSLELYLDRATQYLVETELAKGLERYGASAGEVLVMDPQTGGILAMVSLPKYDPAKFYLADPSLYKNPAVANLYEPGSTFKVLVMAAAIDSGNLKLEDKCDLCNGPLAVDKYFIKTWNNQYHPLSTPEEILVNSDNVGMVWIQKKMGGETMLKYLKSFALDTKTNIDLQEEISPQLRDKWSEVDYATASFGQGIAVTSISMLRAVGAIANQGILMEPHLVKNVIGESVSEIKPRAVRRVISQETAKQVVDLMISSAKHGDAKWTWLPDYQVAGKTGTAQIAIEGHYDKEKTIASFVGFVPAYNPRFVMLVKLREPTSSPWGSETAAPLWFNIAKKLLLHYNIPASR